MRLGMIVTMLSLCLASTGCLLTTMAVSKHNSKVDSHAMLLRVAGNDRNARAEFGVNLLSIADTTRGFVSAWKSDPAGMRKAAALDVLLMGASYAVYDNNRSSGGVTAQAVEPASNGGGQGNNDVTAGGDVYIQQTFINESDGSASNGDGSNGNSNQDAD